MGKGFEKPTIDKFETLGLDGQNTGPQLASANILKDKQNGQGELATIKKAGEKEIMTPEQFKAKARELKKCKNDILYFCQKYFKIVSLRDGLVTLNPYPKQQELLKFIQDNNRVIVTASRQVGKCVQGDTQIRVRNKKTGEEETITIEEFFNRMAQNQTQNQ